MLGFMDDTDQPLSRRLTRVAPSADEPTPAAPADPPARSPRPTLGPGNLPDHPVVWPVDRASAVQRLERPGPEGTAVLARVLRTDTPLLELTEFVVQSTCAAFPAWLPEAEGIQETAAIRAVARGMAGRTASFGPLLERLAEAAQRPGTPPDLAGFTDARVLSECRKLLARAYAEPILALVLEPAADVPMRDTLDRLAALPDTRVVLCGLDVPRPPGLPVLEAWPADSVAETPSATPERGPAAHMSPLGGQPNPLSTTETRFEAYLAEQPWAVGRTWNATWRDGPLTPPLRVDLMWERAGCVVELDGPDHLSAAKYADDRRRDRLLQAAGFAVLRFTNQEVHADMARVGAEIAAYLARRRAPSTEV